MAASPSEVAPTTGVSMDVLMSYPQIIKVNRSMDTLLKSRIS